MLRCILNPLCIGEICYPNQKHTQGVARWVMFIYLVTGLCWLCKWNLPLSFCVKKKPLPLSSDRLHRLLLRTACRSKPDQLEIPMHLTVYCSVNNGSVLRNWKNAEQQLPIACTNEGDNVVLLLQVQRPLGATRVSLSSHLIYWSSAIAHIQLITVTK